MNLTSRSSPNITPTAGGQVNERTYERLNGWMTKALRTRAAVSTQIFNLRRLTIVSNNATAHSEYLVARGLFSRRRLDQLTTIRHRASICQHACRNQRQVAHGECSIRK